MAFLTSSGRFKADARPGRSTLLPGAAITRLVTKPINKTVLMTAATHPTVEMRAARRPVTSKKTGLLAKIHLTRLGAL